MAKQKQINKKGKKDQKNKKETQNEYEKDEQKKQQKNEENTNENQQIDDLQTQKITLYNLLDVPKTASIEEIKKAYKQLALKIHPDKNKDDPTAKEKFQKIVEAYNILSDPNKKKEYDETGSYGDDFNQQAFESAYSFYRSIYKKVEKKDIDDFATKYRNSDMEEEDLINFYNENKGNINSILECIPLSRNEDIDRFIKKYEQLIKDGKIKNLKAFSTSQKQISLLDENEEEGFQEANDDLKELTMQILSKKQNQMSFLDMIEQKYSQKQNKKTKKQNVENNEQENQNGNKVQQKKLKKK
ncbi:hypothetical protein IMG5_206853 [Ichthyophthirius multifiliis]|uniref:J domain-containing protein n=1 Tax=Ichthyophthirius multifiliis TaxID=5932 RepID=G0QNK4_ICHMU|nr:hypothetical protein IMG5_206853 [Ichthyophthirius multifiliis]EGR33193.1 hypothetical protein IMG5_206853 [Ichthyophthirius multifiliis]|eukprot:XP_004037179.1 hypothetical protein IMG5_206853 [Ichthyophthirius multifiliis]